MVGSISFINITANGASLRGVGRIDERYRHTGQLRLVREECAQLCKRPAMQRSSLRLASPYPKADARKFFQGNPAPGAFSLLYDAFADAVVHVGSEASFFAGQLLEATLGRFGAFLLQTLAQATMAMTDIIDVLGGVYLAIGIGGNVDHAEIDAEEAVNVNRIWCLNFARTEQVELTANQAQVAFAAMALQELKLSRPGGKRHLLSTVEGPDAHLLGVQFPGQHSTVKGDGPVRTEGSLPLTVELVGIGNFGDAADGYLCAEPEPVPNVVIDEVMQGELPERLFLPGYLADVVTSLVGTSKRFVQSLALFVYRLQLDLRRKFHYVESISQNTQHVKKGVWRFPPRPKGRGFHRRHLMR